MFRLATLAAAGLVLAGCGADDAPAVSASSVSASAPSAPSASPGSGGGAMTADAFVAACAAYYSTDFAWQPPVAPAEWCGCLVGKIDDEKPLYQRMSPGEIPEAKEGYVTVIGEKAAGNYRKAVEIGVAIDSTAPEFHTASAAVETRAAGKCAKDFR